jgi:hypothetical protein
MEFFPRDLLIYIFRFCRSKDLLRLIGVCHAFRRTLSFAFAPRFAACPLRLERSLGFDSIRGLHWNELFECRRILRSADSAEAMRQTELAIARRAKRGLPPPVFSRYGDGSLFLHSRSVHKYWCVDEKRNENLIQIVERLFFRLGSLFTLLHAVKGALPQSWEVAKKSHRLKLIARCEDLEMVSRLDNQFLSVYGGWNNERTYGRSVVRLKKIGSTTTSWRGYDFEFYLSSRFEADAFVELFEWHSQFKHDGG